MYITQKSEASFAAALAFAGFHSPPFFALFSFLAAAIGSLGVSVALYFNPLRWGGGQWAVRTVCSRSGLERMSGCLALTPFLCDVMGELEFVSEVGREGG